MPSEKASRSNDTSVEIYFHGGGTLAIVVLAQAVCGFALAFGPSPVMDPVTTWLARIAGNWLEPALAKSAFPEFSEAFLVLSLVFLPVEVAILAWARKRRGFARTARDALAFQDKSKVVFIALGLFVTYGLIWGSHFVEVARRGPLTSPVESSQAALVTFVAGSQFFTVLGLLTLLSLVVFRIKHKNVN